MKKIDFKKDLKHLYKPSPKKVEIVEVSQMNFLMIDGQGDRIPPGNFKTRSKRYTAFLIH